MCKINKSRVAGSRLLGPVGGAGVPGLAAARPGRRVPAGRPGRSRSPRPQRALALGGREQPLPAALLCPSRSRAFAELLRGTRVPSRGSFGITGAVPGQHRQPPRSFQRRVVRLAVLTQRQTASSALFCAFENWQGHLPNQPELAPRRGSSGLRVAERSAGSGQQRGAALRDSGASGGLAASPRAPGSRAKPGEPAAGSVAGAFLQAAGCFPVLLIRGEEAACSDRGSFPAASPGSSLILAFPL